MTIDEIIAMVMDPIGPDDIDYAHVRDLCDEIQVLRRRLAAHQPAASDREAEIERLRAENDTMKRAMSLQAMTLNSMLEEDIKSHDEIERLRVRRCHYCDAPMRERELVDESVVKGTYWQCPEGCQ